MSGDHRPAGRPLAYLAAIVLACGCSGAPDVRLATADARTYTLYRNSAIDAEMRIHVATFDAEGRQSYNRGNCDIARELFQEQPGVSVRYWCEKGRFKK